MTNVPASESSSPRANALVLGLLTLGVMLAAWYLYFTHTGFSVQCHADEPGKVLQIQTSERNYHHPLLLLNTVQAVVAATGMEATPQKIVRAGRMTAAAFSALGILAFSCAAWLAGGRLAAILCALFLLGSPLLLEMAHFFKEDPALIMGLGVVFLGIALCQRNPGVPSLLVLALGAALACSAKHLGVVVLPFCLVTVVGCRRGEGGQSAKRPLLLFLAVTLGLYCLINYQAVANLGHFAGGIDREVGFIKDGGQIQTAHTSPLLPLRKYVGLVRGNLPFPLLWFLGFAIYSCIKERSARTPLGQALLLAGVLFLLLAGVPKTAARYVLPVVCLLCFAAALGAARLFAKPGWAWKTAGFALPLVLALGLDISQCAPIFDSFATDNRRQMAQWITQNLPANAVIAQDALGLMASASDTRSDSPYKVPQSLYDAGADIQACTLDALRASGVQYLAVVIDERAESRKRKTGKVAATPFAAELATKCKKVWECSGGKTRVSNVKPDIALYRIAGMETQ